LELRFCRFFSPLVEQAPFADPITTSITMATAPTLNHDGVISDDEQHLTWAQSYDVLINEIKTMAIDTSEELNERF
jgi:hypothetical protein